MKVIKTLIMTILLAVTPSASVMARSAHLPIDVANIIIHDEPTEDEPPEDESPEEETSEEGQKKECPEGKFLNPKTNRCKNLQEVTESSTGWTVTTYDPETGEATVEKFCIDGYYLNIETNRCNKIKEETPSSSSTQTSSVTTTTDKSCPEGKFLNPKTNRCKNLETVTESTTGKTITTYNPETGEATTVKICNEGYELDEDSNRCKKIKENKGEDYKLDVPELGSEGKKDFIGLGSIIAIVVIGVGFVIFQFRKEILKIVQRLCHRKKA